MSTRVEQHWLFILPLFVVFPRHLSACGIAEKRPFYVWVLISHRALGLFTINHYLGTSYLVIILGSFLYYGTKVIVLAFGNLLVYTLCCLFVAPSLPLRLRLRPILFLLWDNNTKYSLRHVSSRIWRGHWKSHITWILDYWCNMPRREGSCVGKGPAASHDETGTSAEPKLENHMTILQELGEKMDQHLDRMDQQKDHHFERMNQHFD